MSCLDNDPQSSPQESVINYAAQINVLTTSYFPRTPRFNELSTSKETDNYHDIGSPNDHFSKSRHMHARSLSSISSNQECYSRSNIHRSIRGNKHGKTTQNYECVSDDTYLNSDDIDGDNFPSSQRDGLLPSICSSSGDSLERSQEICKNTMETALDYSIVTGNSIVTSSNQYLVDRGRLQHNDEILYLCHLCTYTCLSREKFNDHVNGHYEFSCGKCDFTTKEENEYRAHLKNEHQCTPEDLEDAQGVRVPTIKSNGRIKTFKCKHCVFIAVTKEEFWNHSRQHIKPEKMLTCPKCLFVTEYKHHLDYHLRNHFGTKSHKCLMCNYRCVNKSMLNSHMKAHASHYQYGCADCNFVAKYCYNLKCHLRKYGHKPDIVLNPDGTPNPLSTIDVYGSRRGPKRKATCPVFLDREISPRTEMIATNNTRRKEQFQRNANPPGSRLLSHHHSHLRLPQSQLPYIPDVNPLPGLSYSTTGVPLLVHRVLAQLQTMQKLQKTLQQLAAFATASIFAQPPSLMRKHNALKDRQLMLNLQTSAYSLTQSGSSNNRITKAYNS